jgi:broad specificity phosphatase PhoE
LLMAENGKWFKPGDGESNREVERRFSNWMEDELLFNNDFVGRPGRQRIAIVSHGLALQCLFHYIMGFNDSLIDRFPMNNTSISRFRFTAQGWFPISINDATHTEALGDILREGTRG